MMHSITLSLVSTLLAASTVAAYTLAKPAAIPNTLFPRGDFTGGYAIYETTCPADTKSCGNNYHVCCPVGTTCAKSENPGCCPDQDNCFSDLSSIPVCADPNWTLYQGAYKGKFFCCPSDEIGLLPDNSQAGQCAKKSQIVPSSRSASKYPTVEPTRNISSPSSTSGSSASSATGASTTSSSAPSSATVSASSGSASKNAATTATTAVTAATASSASAIPTAKNAGLKLLAEPVHIAVAALVAALGGLIVTI